MEKTLEPLKDQLEETEQQILDQVRGGVGGQSGHNTGCSSAE